MPPVENAGMGVTFTFSREDYLHYVDFWAKRHRRTQLRRTIRLSCLLFAGYVALFLLSNMPVGFAAGLGAFLATVSVSLVHWDAKAADETCAGIRIGRAHDENWTRGDFRKVLAL